MMQLTQKTIIGLLAVLFITSFTSCKQKATPTETASETATPVVYTTFYPTMYFTQRIAGDTATIICPVPPDEDAIFWQPSPDIIADYQQADLIIINGAEFEKWVQTVSLPESRVVNTAAPFADRFIEYTNTTTHTHGAAGKHAHQGIDGHTWLDPINAKIQALEVMKALSARFSEHQDQYEKNYETLQDDLNTIDDRLQSLTPKMNDVTLFASHPAYNYIAQRYEWKITNFDLDPESPLPEDYLKSIPPIMHTTRIMLWESEPLPETVKILAESFKITSITFSPCELLAPDEIETGIDYLSVMNENIDRLEKALE